MNYQIVVGKKRFDVNVVEVGSGVARVIVNGEPYDVTIENYAEVTRSAIQGVALPAPSVPEAKAQTSPGPAAEPRQAPAPASHTRPAAVTGGTPVLAPMPGLIVNVKVAVGDRVKENQTVVTMEAMKMENQIAATASGTVTQILVSRGDQLRTGDVILIIG